MDRLSEDAKAQQVELRTTITLAFDELDAIHVAFNHAIAVGQLEGRFHRIMVTLNTTRKRANGWKCGLKAVLEPFVKSLRQTLTDNLGKTLGSRGGELNIG